MNRVHQGGDSWQVHIPGKKKCYLDNAAIWTVQNSSCETSMKRRQDRPHTCHAWSCWAPQKPSQGSFPCCAPLTLWAVPESHGSAAGLSAGAFTGSPVPQRSSGTDSIKELKEKDSEEKGVQRGNHCFNLHHMYNAAELQALGSHNSECPDFCVFKISTVALQHGAYFFFFFAFNLIFFFGEKESMLYYTVKETTWQTVK